MNIYIDFKTAKEKTNLAQAIKVFATAYKTDHFYIICDSNKSTLVDDENIHLINSIDKDEINNLYTLDSKCLEGEIMRFALLRPSSKEIESLIVGDLNFNNFNIDEKFNMLKDKGLINKNRKFALLGSSINSKEFNNVDTSKYEFCDGIIMPKDIIPLGISTVVTSPEISNIFIDSLYYSIEYLKLKREDEESSSTGFMNKLFSWNKEPNKKVTINLIINDYQLGINKDKLFFVPKDGMTYNFYYHTLDVYYKLLKLNNVEANK